MLVRTIMTSPVISIQPESQVGNALEIMKANHIRHLPVIAKNFSVVGLVSESDLIKVYSNKQASSYQVNLVSRTPIRNVMVPNPITIGPDDAIEDAAEIMRKHKLVCLPVVENGKLTGLVCEDDVLRSFINILGLGQPGLRITMAHQHQKGFLLHLVDLLDVNDAIIDKMVTFQQELVLKVQTPNPEQLLETLNAKGYKLLHTAIIPTINTKTGS